MKNICLRWNKYKTNEIQLIRAKLIQLIQTKSLVPTSKTYPLVAVYVDYTSVRFTRDLPGKRICALIIS